MTTVTCCTHDFAGSGLADHHPPAPRVRRNGFFPFTLPAALEAVDDVEPMRRRAGEGLPESVTTGAGDGDTTRWRRRAILDGLRRLAVFVALFLVVEFLRRWRANEAMTAWAESGSGKEKTP